jgi:hypothetical protein
MYRARVFSEVYSAGRVWVYEVYNTEAPEGNQVWWSGMRNRWVDALAAVRERLGPNEPLS